MKNLVYSGFIIESVYGEDDDVLFIGENAECPIACVLEEEIAGKQVSVRYWISNKKKTKEELQESFLKELFGVVDASYTPRYSETTGYLWTDEELNIGGHDLLSELRSYIGKFIFLEIDVHR
jgi:hypothetical protein